MRFRDQVALTLPALFLRVMLASVFLWAGLAKVMTTVAVGPEQAAALASLNVPIGAPETAQPAPAPTPRLPEPDRDPQAAPEPETAPVPAATLNDEPEVSPSETPAPDAELPDPGADDPANGGTLLLTAWSQDEAASDAAPEESTAEEAASSIPSAGLITASDYPEGGTVRMVEMLALNIDRATNPTIRPDGSQYDPIWPDVIGSGPWPRVNAWAVAITEIAAGAFILIGLFTRISALSLFTIMLGAMWLTGIGPAMQQSTTMLGFLPDHALHDFESWRLLWMQFALAMSALAVVFLGAGPVSLDRAFFRRSTESFDAGPKYTTATDAPPEAKRPV